MKNKTTDIIGIAANNCSVAAIENFISQATKRRIAVTSVTSVVLINTLFDK